MRNAVAHNDIIFDTRYRNAGIGKPIKGCLERDTRITNIDFSTIMDYLILVCYLLKNMQVSKTDIKKMVTNFGVITETLRRKVPANIFSQVIHTNTRTKINQLENFIKL